MGTVLYDHNQTAYEAVLSLLHKTKKAAIIHPTGTGKSFIAFKLCEDHPNDTVCWLSPSEYIFQTQSENWLSAGGEELSNIRFLTYAKLMLMEEAELAEIQPRYIILDEFHRCGAQLWGQGVQKLLAMYPDALLLGLTATSIRYLDNQRNMADELFDGNIASEITLGEAIVRGILNPPKYVLSVYSYQKDIEHLEARIRHTRSKAAKAAAEQYLEALRRALEKADGLDVVFDKHMPDLTGKYIVFCSNVERMREMMELSSEWFWKVDTKPHIYSVYSSDPSASKSFADFKADDDRTHLRLLYCIDALNEGIHLEDISGVILLRPTVSPIVFKQQIGRALSASKKTEAVIFDIVLNISNLYSIDALEEEMQTAAAYYRSLGEGDEIVQEYFRIIDEVQDYRILFEKLDEVLTTSWSVMYEQAKRYYMENGDLEVPARYVTEDGYSLGHWVYNQRYIRKGVLDGNMTQEKIAGLDAIGMRWDVLADTNWEKNFAAAHDFYEENGDLNVPVKYTTKNGIALGQWLATLRAWERAGVHPKYLTPERKAQLEAIGMIWDKLDHLWERNYHAACVFYREHGNLDVPSSYVDPDGIRLGAWISRMRKLRKDVSPRPEGSLTDMYSAQEKKTGAKGGGTVLTQEQIDRLEEIGMIWDKRTDQVWRKSFLAAKSYVLAYGNLLVPEAYETAEGVKLGAWIQRQRLLYKKGTLSAERVRHLEEIGMVWDTHSWMRRYAFAKQYCMEHGTADIPQNIVMEGCWVGKWLAMQKKLCREGKLTGEQGELLSALEQLSRAV